jgi:chemotaxis response regulator CheB
MTKVAVIEDDAPTSNQLASWIRSAGPGIEIDQWFNRDDAEAALAREGYDVVVLDIELGRERHAGVAIINAINKLHQGTPVLVVSAMPRAIYRGIMKALDAWDYLQKTTFEETEFIDTSSTSCAPPRAGGRAQSKRRRGRGRALARPAAATHADVARRAHQPAAHRPAHPRDAAIAAAARWCPTTSSSTW